MIGSDSGAIPTVVGEAGRIVPEADVDALTRMLRTLRDQPALRAELISAGRARFLKHFTHESVAQATVAVYQQLLLSPP